VAHARNHKHEIKSHQEDKKRQDERYRNPSPGATRFPDEVQLKAEIARMIEHAKEHATRGDKRGAYLDEGLRSPVILMKNPERGYCQDNTEIVSLGALLLIEAGFSREEIQELFKVTTLDLGLTIPTTRSQAATIPTD
jgi:hypothetical protein